LASSTLSLQRNFAFDGSYSTLPQWAIAATELLELSLVSIPPELEETVESTGEGGVSSLSLEQENMAIARAMIIMIKKLT
jgi:hypothetical protein